MLCIITSSMLPAFGGRERHPEVRHYQSYGPGTSGESQYLIDLTEEEIAAYGNRLPKIAPVDVADKARFERVQQTRHDGDTISIPVRLNADLNARLRAYAAREGISLNLAMVRAVEQLTKED